MKAVWSPQNERIKLKVMQRVGFENKDMQTFPVRFSASLSLFLSLLPSHSVQFTNGGNVALWSLPAAAMLMTCSAPALGASTRRGRRTAAYMCSRGLLPHTHTRARAPYRSATNPSCVGLPQSVAAWRSAAVRPKPLSQSNSLPLAPSPWIRVPKRTRSQGNQSSRYGHA